MSRIDVHMLDTVNKVQLYDRPYQETSATLKSLIVGPIGKQRGKYDVYPIICHEGTEGEYT